MPFSQSFSRKMYRSSRSAEKTTSAPYLPPVPTDRWNPASHTRGRCAGMRRGHSPNPGRTRRNTVDTSAAQQGPEDPSLLLIDYLPAVSVNSGELIQESALANVVSHRSQFIRLRSIQVCTAQEASTALQFCHASASQNGPRRDQQAQSQQCLHQLLHLDAKVVR